MFTDKDRQQQPKSSKKVIYALLAGSACVAVGTMGYNAMPWVEPDHPDMENESMSLSSLTDATLHGRFYKSIANECNEWSEIQSKELNTAAAHMKPDVLFFNKYKGLMARYGGEDFTSVKNNMMDLIDGFTDSQRDLQSTQKYYIKQQDLMVRRLEEPRWKMQHKYSTRIGKKCIQDAERVEKNFNTLRTTDKTMRKDMHKLANDFSHRADADLAVWQCDKMYPTPVRTTMDWWEMVTGVFKKGFEIFNAVKGLIPGGELLGGLVPGMPKEAEMEFFDFLDFDEDMTQLKFFGGDTEETWRERQRIHKEALRICNHDRQFFIKAMNQIEIDLTRFSSQHIFKNFKKMPEDLPNHIDTYNKDAIHFASLDNKMSSSEYTHTLEIAHSSDKAFKSGLKLIQKNMHHSLALKAKIIE